MSDRETVGRKEVRCSMRRRLRDSLDHLTIRHTAAVAVGGDPFQLGSQQRQASHLRLDVGEVAAGDSGRRAAIVIRLTRQGDQRLQLVSRETQLPPVADEFQPFDVGIAVNTATGIGARGRGHEPDVFIEADRIDLGAGTPRQLSDHQHRHTRLILQ